MQTTDAPRPALDAAGIDAARRLLVTALANDVPWWEHANASSRLSAWLTEHAEQLLAAAAERATLRERVSELEERHAVFYTLEQEVTAALHRCGSELVRAQRRRREGANDGG